MLEKNVLLDDLKSGKEGILETLSTGKGLKKVEKTGSKVSKNVGQILENIYKDGSILD